ncbi:MAG: hypothetical protein NVS3B6_17800 [Pseudarthrobacter sp.]
MSGSVPDKLLGLYQMGNMNVYLDRAVLKTASVLEEWNGQPTLTNMTEAALRVLENKPNGFFLMVEGASIDKQEHPMDGPRALYDTIGFDRAIGGAKRWAEGCDDTLIIVTADHNHSMSIVGTHDRRFYPADGFEVAEAVCRGRGRGVGGFPAPGQGAGDRRVGVGCGNLGQRRQATGGAGNSHWSPGRWRRGSGPRFRVCRGSGASGTEVCQGCETVA